MAMNQKGFTLVELMVTMLISSIVILGILGAYTHTVSVAYDQKVKLVAKLQADAVLQTIGAELRSLGNGVPFDQANFQIGENTLTDITVTYPLLIADSDADTIKFRLNESGRTYILTSDFDPSSTSVIPLTEVQGLTAGNIIYITNSVMDGDDGFYGTIQSVDSGALTITIEATYEVSPGATFVSGSLLEAVNIITYDSPGWASGILRSNGGASITMAQNATMSFKYLTEAGVEVATPLTESALINQIRAIEVTVNVRSTSPLKSGGYYTSTVQQIYGLRNLNYLI